MVKNRIRSLSIVAELIALLALTSITSRVTFADSPRATLAILPGGLFETDNSVTINSNNAVMQNGTDQSLPIRISLPVTDATGTGAGWKVTIKGTAFSDGNGNTLDNMPEVNGVTSISVPGSSSTAPRNSTAYTNYTVPTGIASTLFNATANTGMGKFILKTAMSLKIQSVDVVGTYTSTFTVAISSGPQ